MKKYLKDVKKGIDILESGEKIRNFNFTLVDIRDLQRVYCDLLSIGSAITIQETIYCFALYCGLKTQTHGIGWKIYACPAIGK